MISSSAILALVSNAKKHSDMCHESLNFLANQFVDAHESVAPHGPDNLSLEVGTRRGGSAYLMLRLLERLYLPPMSPMLFTVDPYGGKPYAVGEAGSYTVPDLYGSFDYQAAKTLLAEFPNHAHFYLTAGTFLTGLRDKHYWWMRVERPINGLAFVLLDGDHTAKNIAAELDTVWPLMRRGGRVLIDNTDRDPNTQSVLSVFGTPIVGPKASAGDQQLVLVKGDN